MIYNTDELDLIKSITRAQAKAVHGELPPGGEWRTIKGHHIYLKDGKILAGSIPGVTKAKKATKAQLAEHQATIDKEKKPSKAKAPAKGKTKTATPKPKEKANGTAKKPTSKTQTAAAKEVKPAKPKGAGKSVPGAKKPASEDKPKSKPTAKKGKAPAKDIRSDAQKNRTLAYDVGDKVGGARKDEYIASFRANPTAMNLAELEKMSGAVAEKMVTKANIMPAFEPEKERDNGVELPATVLKKLIYDRISPKPDPSTPESRKAYVVAMSKLHRQLAGIKTWDNMKNAIRELSEYARNTSTKQIESTKSTIQYQTNQANGVNAWGGKVTPEEQEKGKLRKKEFEDRLKKSLKDKESFNFEALGDKLNNFFTDWDSRERTIKSVQKNAAGGWDKYLEPKKAKAAPKERGEENKKWERSAEAEHLRTGGKNVTMNKPEELMKQYGLRGVEFGNWVNDSSGKYHLQRSAEAFSDLADIIGIDPKDISLNGRLAIAFGARGKGTALAHYEPDRKVINMTKYGGAGSLAHEWGHAMDNILYQYSNGGQESLGLASKDQMGATDPKLNALYSNLMDAITKPAPGEKGGTHQVILDSTAKKLGRYFPEMRRDITGGMSPEDAYHKWAAKTNSQYDRYIENAKANTLRSPADKAKAIKDYENKRKRELRDIPHYIAKEMKYKNGGWNGEDYKGHIEVPTGKSEYATRMDVVDGGSKEYWGSNEEMFARVFESYVQHKLDGKKRYNNYLVHGTRELNVKKDDAPFPIGKERQHMFKAMGNLIDYISSKGALKKALMLEVLASGRGDMTEELRKSLGYTKRSAFNVANPEECIYIPLNRLRTPYQTDKATNWDKVKENQKRMQAGENLEPISIGLDYDIHDGHHRYEASKLEGHEHAPCVVKGGNDMERERAIEAYKEVWKAIVTDPVAPGAFEDDEGLMFRGIGQKELDFITKNGYIQSKGKGNDEDKENAETCFSNLYSQAAGYARSNYDLYNEKHAYVVAVPKPSNIEEDEHGELIARGRVPFKGAMIIPIPNELERG